MDHNLGGTDARDACRLIFMASLANVPERRGGPLHSRDRRDTCARRAATCPGSRPTSWKSSPRPRGISTRTATASSTSRTSRTSTPSSNPRRGVRPRAVDEGAARPPRTSCSSRNGWCYQRGAGAARARRDRAAQRARLTLVISEPYRRPGAQSPARAVLRADHVQNRVAFLTGSRNTFDNPDRRRQAAQSDPAHPRRDGRREGGHDNDPQFKQADELRDRILGQFLSAVKETFSTLYYPLDR